jgi:D-inositol-3-phosphate glycosyltransferase
MQKSKILFWGDAVVETGFARVLHSIAKFLPEQYDISWIGVNYFGDPHKYKERIYPASVAGDIYGIRRFNDIATKENPDIIFIVNDAWIQAHLLDEIKKFYTNKKLPKIISYVPVDAEDHDSDWYKNFDVVSTVVAYTEFGKKEIIKAAPQLESRLMVVAHGVDTSVFHKLPGTKEALKKSFYPDNPSFYEDSFIVFNGNRNQPRKRIDITMLAFKMFAEGKPENVKLYLHMGVTDSHVDVIKLAKRLKIDNKLILTSPKTGVQNVSIDRLNQIYNVTDVGLNTGLGEGFSLTNIEHAATGAPQVVADHSALRELYSDCGLLVPAEMQFVLDNIMTTGYLVKPEDVADRLESLYHDGTLYNSLSKLGYDKFTSPEYSWKQIAKQWVKIFEA